MIAILSRVVLTSYVLIAAQLAPETASGISGTVKDLCGSDMPGVTVSAVNAEGLTTEAQTDASGRYILHLQPGTWTLTFQIRGFREHRQDVVIAASDSDRQMNIRLPLAGLVEMIVTHGPKARYRMYTVQGVVRADDGTGIPNAIIRLRPARPSPFVVTTDMCTSDEEGRYATAGWSTKPIRWRLSVEAGNYRPYDLRDLDLTADEAKTLDIHIKRR